MEQHKYERIDKGVKRPKIRNGQVTLPSHQADLGSWEIPADLDPDVVLRQYLTEATTGQIARQYGISRKALTQWLRTVRKAAWRNAQIVRALAIKEDSENGLAIAPDALSLARARELLRSAQFDLQALDDDFRPKQDVQHSGAVAGPMLNIVLSVAPQQHAAPLPALEHGSEPDLLVPPSPIP